MFKKLRSEVNVVTIIGIFVVVIMLLTILPGLTVNFSGGGTPISVTIGANTYVIATSADAQAIIDADAWNGVDGVYVDSVNGVAGTTDAIGTPGKPVSNLTDALTIAQARKLTKFYLNDPSGTGWTLGFDYPDSIWQFIGVSVDLNGDIFNANNHSVGNSVFRNMYLTGKVNVGSTGGIELYDSSLGPTFDTGPDTLITMYGGQISVSQIFSGELDTFNTVLNTVFDLTNNYNRFRIRGTGALTITNATVLNSPEINIYGMAMNLTIDASCVGGTINIYGDVKVTNNSAGTTVNDYTATTQTDELYQNAHSVQQVAPDNAAGVTLTSGAAPWTLGAFATIIAANSDASGGTEKFDIHGLDVEDASANAKYEIVLYGTVGGVADTVIGHATFTRTNATTVSRSTTMMTPQVDKGSPIKAKLESSTGAGTETCDVKVWYHNYK